ncbi:MAG TPA: hypothetical protein VJY33_12270, partial [Isosphaeraceae bacterium]|nr:hypothetical protein [Isosphaeraceae bacterium]
ADGKPSLAKKFNNLSTHSANASRSPRDENRCVDRHRCKPLCDVMESEPVKRRLIPHRRLVQIVLRKTDMGKLAQSQ